MAKKNGLEKKLKVLEKKLKAADKVVLKAEKVAAKAQRAHAKADDKASIIASKIAELKDELEASTRA